MDILRHLAESDGFEEQPPWVTLPPHLVHIGLQEVLDRSWFERIWTVQEVALSSQRTTIMCDEEIVTWPADAHTVSLFVRGIKLAVISAQWTESRFAGAEALGIPSINLDGLIELLELQLQQIRRRQKQEKIVDEPDLLDLAYSFRNRLSTDLRDRIYAIRGLALIRGVSEEWLPDYSKPLNEVHNDFRKLLRKSAKRETRYPKYQADMNQVDGDSMRLADSSR